MSSGSCGSLDELPEHAHRIVLEARRAVLATVDRRARPHAVPVGYALRGSELVTAIDGKPKSGTKLARVSNIESNSAVTLLVDRWDEDWSRLGWVMVRGTARLEAPGTADRELLARYPQYGDEPPSGRVIVIRPQRILWWTWE
jgi:PPOX class probable F420-dependent enzyme